MFAPFTKISQFDNCLRITIELLKQDQFGKANVDNITKQNIEDIELNATNGGIVV